MKCRGCETELENFSKQECESPLDDNQSQRISVGRKACCQVHERKHLSEDGGQLLFTVGASDKCVDRCNVSIGIASLLQLWDYARTES